MKYLFTSVEEHIDFGFGLTGDAYFDCARHIHEEDKILTPQLGQLPICFLYRHSIELHLKSLIIILHKTLKLPYGTEPFDTVNPQILVNGKWMSLFACHWLDELYKYWLQELLYKYSGVLNEMTPKARWVEEKPITALIQELTKYDRDSSFFRYPLTKQTRFLDNEKFSVRKLELEYPAHICNYKRFIKTKVPRGSIILCERDDNGQILKAYGPTNDTVKILADKIQEIAVHFNGIHWMARTQLCSGY